MASNIPPQKASVPVGKLLYRFLTGLHMDGKHRQNYRTRHVLPQYRNYFWNRYTRKRRAAWRLSITLIAGLTAWGLVIDKPLTTYCVAACLPFISAWATYKIGTHLTVRVNVTTGDGISETYRTLRPKHYRRLRRLMRFRFKLRPPTDTAIPSDWERPIMAELAEDGIAPVQQLRRPLQPPMDIDELLKQHGPRDKREKTHRRNAKRRLPNG